MAWVNWWSCSVNLRWSATETFLDCGGVSSRDLFTRLQAQEGRTMALGGGDACVGRGRLDAGESEGRKAVGV